MLKAFDEGNLCYQLRYFLTDLHEDDLTDSMVRVHLFASLQRAGIRIAEPQRTAHAITRDQAHAETVRRRELTRRLEALATVPPFATLPEETKADIAERLQYAPFARGDIITKQGNKAHWLYILAFGEAEVLYEPPNGAPQRARQRARGRVLRRDGADHRRRAHRHRGGEDRRRVLPPRPRLVPGAAARRARRSPRRSSASWAGGAATSSACARRSMTRRPKRKPRFGWRPGSAASSGCAHRRPDRVVRARHGHLGDAAPFRPHDRDIEYAFVSGLSPETRSNRLLGGARAITREYIESLVSVDFSRDMALAATTMLGGGETLIGVARYVRDKNDEAAEFAIVIADSWHGRGIGSRLLGKLVEVARSRGLQRLYGDILAINRPMLALSTKLGFQLSRHPDDPTLTRASISLR